MELSYDSSEWASDEDGHQSTRIAVNKPKPKRMCQVREESLGRCARIGDSVDATLQRA
jgi:hypothetical protein